MGRESHRELLYAVAKEVLAVMPRCRCGKWGTYLGNYDQNGYTIRCSGCLRAIWECRC